MKKFVVIISHTLLLSLLVSIDVWGGQVNVSISNTKTSDEDNKKINSISSQLTLEKLIEINHERYKTHEARPQGVPAEYDWSKKPRVGAGNNQRDYLAATGWGQVFWVPGVKSSDFYMQIRNFNFLVCHGKEHQWVMLQNGSIEGKQFRSDYVKNSNKSALFFKQQNGVATVDFEVSSAFHFWPEQGQVSLPTDPLCGVLVLAQARLIPKSDVKTTSELDINLSPFLIGLGGDYWRKLNSKWDQFKTNTDIAIGRLKFISTDWNWYGMSTASDEDISKLYISGFKLGDRVNIIVE